MWIPSGICSVTCGGGVRRYERQCNNPPPKNGGLPCRGDDYKYEPCNTECCPGEYTNDVQLYFLYKFSYYEYKINTFVHRVAS